MDADRFVIADREGFGGDVCLRDIRIRRCVGCVTCLTEHPGSCKIEDGFTDVSSEAFPIRNHDPADKVKLRRIVFECRGEFADRMESEMTGALRKGPVSDVIFIQKQRS